MLAFAGTPAMLIFVAIVNKIRAGAFAPRWDELKQRKAAQQRSRGEEIFIVLLVFIAAPFTVGVLAWALGNFLNPQSPRGSAPLGLAGLIGGLALAIGHAFRILRKPSA